MDCQYCNNTFKTISSLNYHVENAKYCLKLRNTINTKLLCEWCKRCFSSKHWLTVHKNKCISNIKNIQDKCICLEKDNIQLEKDNIQLEHINNTLIHQLQDQKEIIQDLQNKLENIALSAVSRPTTSNKTQINNYIQQLQPVTDEHLIDNVQHLTIDHIMKGPEGYAQYALEYPLKDRLICVDYARRKVKFKNKDGKVITDPEMSNLATKFFNSIKDKNKELIIECGEKLKENFGDELDTIVKIFDYKAGVERSSDGEKSEFHHDFVKQVCSQTIKE